MVRRTNRTARTLVLGVAAAAALTLGGWLVWRSTLADASEPVSVDEALRRFREQVADNSGRIPPGVYVYATQGFEYVSALGGSRHRYPARSAITITPTGCGVALRWEPLTTRTNVVTVCSERTGLRVARWTEQHAFFGREDRTDWECEGTAWVPSDLSPGSVSRYRCRSKDSTQDGTSTVVGTETVLVGGSSVRAVHVRADAQEAGGARGPLVEDRWLEPESGLPLRIIYRVQTQNPSLIGDVTFEERYDLRLTSLEPRR